MEGGSAVHPFSIPDRLDPMAPLPDTDAKRDSHRQKPKPQPHHAPSLNDPGAPDGSEDTPNELDELA
jgi:hypothetical protein